MKIRNFLLLSYLFVTFLKANAQQVVYSSNGLALELNATLSNTYEYVNIHGSAETRYVWDVKAILKNSNATGVTLSSFYIKRTIKCYEGSGGPIESQSNCKIGAFLENGPIYLRPEEERVIFSCFNTNCGEDLPLDWFISNWKASSSDGKSIIIPGKSAVTLFRPGSKNGFDPATLKIMNDVKNEFLRVEGDGPKYRATIEELTKNSFLGSRQYHYKRLRETIALPEKHRRLAILFAAKGNPECSNYNLTLMKTGYESFKGYGSYLTEVDWLNPNSPELSMQQVVVILDKHYNSVREKNLPIISLATKKLGGVTCSEDIDVMENWNEGEYKLTSSPNMPLQTTTGSHQKRQNPTNTTEVKSDNRVSNTNIKSENNEKIGLKKIDNETDSYQKKIEDEVKAYTRMIETTPRIPKNYTERALRFSAMGKNELAIADLDKAESLGDRSQALYIRRGFSYCLTNRIDDAISDFNRAIKIDETSNMNAPVYSQLGSIYERKGLLSLAIKYYQLALTITPDYIVAQDGLDRIIKK